MRDGVPTGWRGMILVLCLLVALPAAVGEVTVTFLIPDEDHPRYLPIGVDGCLLANAPDYIPGSEEWSADLGDFGETSGLCACYHSSEPFNPDAETVTLTVWGPEGDPDPQTYSGVTHDIVVYAADLDADAVSDDDPGPSDDPEEDPGLFIGAGEDERQRITLATVPGGILPTGGTPDIERWDVSLWFDPADETASIWNAASGGDQVTQSSWEAYWEGGTSGP